MGYERWTKAKLIARLELLEESMAGPTTAVWRATSSLADLSEFERARVVLAFQLAETLASKATEPKDVPRLVKELREVLAELEPPVEDDDDDIGAELARLTAG